MNETHGHEGHHHNHSFTHPWPFLRDIEKLGDDYLVRKAPWQLPHNWKEIIAKLLPVLALIVALLAIPGILGGLLFILGVAGRGAMNRGVYGVYG